MIVVSIITGVIGLALGAALAWIVASGRISALRSAYESVRTQLDSERRARADERATNARIMSERERTIDEQLKRMMAEMGNVTVKALEEREKTLSARNSEQVGNLLAPMRQQLEDFRKAAEESRKVNGDLGVKIEGFFKGIRDTSVSFSVQAKSFTDALTGANKKQGNWGETILGQLLANCGLVEGEHFLAQTGSGECIPDYQVFDPGGAKILVIDSKMSWTKYAQAYDMPEGAERTAALKEHVASVKRHIDELVKVDYPHKLTPPTDRPGYQYVPLTAMFVPCDAALACAIEFDPSIIDYAFKHGIALVSPLTLFGFLQLISRAWSKYNTERNSDAIFDEARKLVTYVDRLFKALESMGVGLESVRKNYENAMQLAAMNPSGQCVKGPVSRIIKLGARPEKGLKSKGLSESNVASIGLSESKVDDTSPADALQPAPILNEET